MGKLIWEFAVRLWIHRHANERRCCSRGTIRCSWFFAREQCRRDSRRCCDVCARVYAPRLLRWLVAGPRRLSIFGWFVFDVIGARDWCWNPRRP